MPHIAGSTEQPRGAFGQCAWGCARRRPDQRVRTRVLCSCTCSCAACARGARARRVRSGGTALSHSSITPFHRVHPCCFPLLAVPRSLQHAKRRSRTQPLAAAGPLRAVIRRGPFKARAPPPCRPGHRGRRPLYCGPEARAALPARLLPVPKMAAALGRVRKV